MQKCFLFSLCNGCYDYTICIIQAETLKEAVEIGKKTTINFSYEGLCSSENIQGYNYDYKNDIDKRAYISYNSISNFSVFKKSYSELLEASTDDIKNTLLNGSEYLFTNKSFYDVMECLMPVPKGYIYTNGHSG